MKSKPKIFEKLEEATLIVPSPFYWADVNCVIVGGNEECLGPLYASKLVGKSAYDLYTPETAAIIEEHSKLVMQTGKKLTFEETYVLLDGTIQHVIAKRSPLFEDGKTVGLVGFLTDITAKIAAEKKAIRLQAESEADKKLVIILERMAHDIRSPARAMCSTLDDYATAIPEAARVSLKATAMNIFDVASSYLGTNRGDAPTAEEKKPIIACLDLIQVFSEKRYQYTGSAISFTEDYSKDSKFIFINVQRSHFKRMISNLLNNAIEALEGKKGTIQLSLSTDEMKKDLIITIQDTGKGMPEEVINKIKTGIHVATDKKEGHGIGLGQIQETIKNNWGKLDIVSVLGEGTKMIITFPITVAPEWLTTIIKLNKDDLVVVLDDDPSIHSIWDTYFKTHASSVQLKHFTLGKEAAEFINNFPNKNKLYLLTDYELIKQNITGMDVIKQTDIQHATVVTSHYAEPAVQKLAAQQGVGLLPKDLAMNVAIEVCDNDKCIMTSVARKVGFVIADDNEIIAKHAVKSAESKGINADKYSNPDNFLKNVYKYDKDILILVDHEFKGSELSGFDVLKKLHKLGFTNLHLFSGGVFKKGEIPEYVIVIPKSDIDAFMKLLDQIKPELPEKTEPSKTKIIQEIKAPEADTKELKDLIHKANGSMGIISMFLRNIKSDIAEQEFNDLMNAFKPIRSVIDILSSGGYKKDQISSNQSVAGTADALAKEESSKSAVNVVIVDNMKPLANSVALAFRKKNKIADVYYDPHSFLQNAPKYNKNIPIIMDYDLEDDKLNGLDVLKQLHDLGFTKLYLFSGSEIEKGMIPEYVTFIPKDNIDAIMALAEG